MKSSHVCFLIGITLATIATISCVIAFSIPSWLYTYEDDSEIGISHAGLWTFCLDTFFDSTQRASGSNCDNSGGSASDGCFNNGEPMYGCHWIYSDALKEIRWTILNPTWYIAVQIMATVNLMLSLLGLLGLYVICVIKKNKCPLIFGIISMFFCGALGLCEVVLYAMRFKDKEYYKVPNINAKSLGAGWGMAVVATIMSMFATVALMIAYVTDEDRRARIAERRASKMIAREQKYGLTQPGAASY